MPKSIKLTLSEDEAAIIVDALDTDLEGYIDAAKDARANGNRADVATFEEAAGRIRAVKDKLRPLIGE
jgi:cation transport regulator ChaB